MSSAGVIDTISMLLGNPTVRTVFEEAMRQLGKTGWAVSRAVAPALKVSPGEIEKVLQLLQEKNILQSIGGTGLSAYYSATPLAFELKETLNR